MFIDLNPKYMKFQEVLKVRIKETRNVYPKFVTLQIKHIIPKYDHISETH